MDINKLVSLLKDKDVIANLTTEEAKKQLMVCINEKVLPVAREAGDEYIKQLREQSKKEKGWTMFRDCFFIPAIINMGYFLFSQATRFIIANTFERADNV